MKTKKLILAMIGVCFGMALISCNNNDSDEAQNSTSSQTTTTTAVTRPVDIPVADKYIAITFDDGPNNSTTCDVLDVLEEYNARATFFLIGNNITDATSASVKRAYDMGCEIANHSQTHSYMNQMSTDEIAEEMNSTNQLIYDIIGEYPAFFRPPYIAVNDTMFQTIDVPFVCGYGCNDWDNSVEIQERIDSVLSQAKDGGIILLHDSNGNFKTVEALKTIIPELQSQGYALVTLSQLFEVKGITPIQDNVLYNFVEQTGMYS